MANACFVPSESGINRRIFRQFGHIVEWFVKQEYCLAKARCHEFVQGGSGTDFFDERSTTTRCRFLASFLATHNPGADEGFISGTCEIRKRPVDPDDPDDDQNERFPVPDIITHEPDRMEFYEIKPNSEPGKKAGDTKIQAFKAMVDFLGMTYRRGVKFDPDRSILIWDGTWLGYPVKAHLHFFRWSEALIVYEICITISVQLISEVMLKAIVRLAVAALIILMAPILAGGGVVVLAWNSPLGDTVGPDGTNELQDVRYVQALLADWANRAGNAAIEIDGALSAAMNEAIAAFQATFLLGDTGSNVYPGDETIKRLERIHLQSAVASVVTSEMEALGMEGMAESVFRDDPDGIDPEYEMEPDLLTALNTEVQAYLQELHHNA